MELCESVQSGLQSLADPSSFDQSVFPVLLDVSFGSLLSSPADPAVLDRPELKQINKILLKQTHTAATTFILEAVKHNADKSTIGVQQEAMAQILSYASLPLLAENFVSNAFKYLSCLEELSFSAERIELFYSAYQKHKKELENLLASIGNRPPVINDVSWRLQYHMKNGHVDQVDQPFYLISLNTEKEGTCEDVNFTCTMEQLQDLVGKLKDAAKSVEKASQM